MVQIDAGLASIGQHVEEHLTVQDLHVSVQLLMNSCCISRLTLRACSAIANKIFCTGTNKVMQGENGGKADESEIS